MKMEYFEEQFLDYIEGKLSPEETAALEKALQENSALKYSFEQYKSLFAIEENIAAEQHELSPGFAVKVLDKVENLNIGFFRRLFMDITLNKKIAYGTFASIAGLICVAQLVRVMPDEVVYHDLDQTGPVLAKPLEELSLPVVKKEEVPVVPIEASKPEDPNSVSIKVDPKTSVEGWASPGTRVDIVWQTKIEGKQAVVVISQKNLVQSHGKDEIKLQIAPEDKAKIKLAEKTGKLSISLSGNPEVGTQPLERGSAGQPRTVNDLLAGSAPTAKNPAQQFDGSPSRPMVLYNQTLTLSEPAVAARSVTNQNLTINGQGYLGEQYYRNTHANNETYSGFEENPRTDVAKEPSSTFSIDVDTASYTNARRYLKSGVKPPKDSIRIEEFVNYFDYNYPQQYKDPFSLSYEIAPSPLEQDRYLLKLGIKARDIKSESKPWNLVFLVDVSGSMMAPNKLTLVQRSLRLLTENMRENDKVAIVTYAGSAGTVLESTSIKDKAKILAAIDSLNAGGSTNGSGGIIAAYEQAQRNKIENGVNRVVLATDGDFNVGIFDRTQLTNLIEEKRKSGVTLTTLGFGEGNINDSTMELLANKGNGNYFYIDSFQEARKVLENDLFGTMEVVAKDVKLQIEFNPANVASYRLIGYENRKLKREDFNNDAIDAGEIGSGHTVTALYEIILANSPLAQKMSDEYRYQPTVAAIARETKTPAELGAELAFLKIRFKQPEGSESSLLRFPIERKYLKTNDAETSVDFKFAAAVSYFGHLLRSSQFAGNYTYSDILKLAQSAKGEDSNGYRQEFIELVKNASSIK